MFLNDRGAGSFMQVTSTPFQPALDPTERFNGTVSQPGAPLNLPVPPSARPMGLVVF